MNKITLQDWITSSGAYPEREKSAELTGIVRATAVILLDKVNKLLDELNYQGSRKLSSGFRPSNINAATPGSAKKSAHMSGKACDIADDKDQTLAKLVASRPDLLRKYGLFLEDPNSTRGKYTSWCHIDYMNRADRPSRVFKP